MTYIQIFLRVVGFSESMPHCNKERSQLTGASQVGQPATSLTLLNTTTESGSALHSVKIKTCTAHMIYVYEFLRVQFSLIVVVQVVLDRVHTATSLIKV